MKLAIARCRAPLVHVQFGRGQQQVATLDHAQLREQQPEFLELHFAVDGTRTIAEICAMGIAIPVGEVRDAPNLAARLGLMVD